MECMICGQCNSVVTVYRKWMNMLVRSDECAECYEYMNQKTGMPVNSLSDLLSNSGLVIDISSGVKYRVN